MKGSMVAENQRPPRRRPSYDRAQPPRHPQFSTASAARRGPDSARRRSYHVAAGSSKKRNTATPSSQTRAETATPKSKKTLQKPKHLKRKLDAAHDETEKTEILVQLETLQQRKQKRPKQSTARQSSDDCGTRCPVQPSSRSRTDNEPWLLPDNGEVDREENTAVSSSSRVAGIELEQQPDLRRTQHSNAHDNSSLANNHTAALVQDCKPRRRRGRKDTSKVGAKLGQRDNQDNCDNQGTDTINRQEQSRETKDSGWINENKTDCTPETTAGTQWISAEGCKEDSEEKLKKAPIQEPVTETISVADNNESSKDDEGSTDSERSADDTPLQRQRGKKRRGRKDTSQIIQEQIPEFKDDPIQREGKADDKSDRPKDRDRRCIGRRPLTDFEVGQSYPGTVVYVKPFGVFLDIGSHSDAFCHVSRLSDDFVGSPDALFRPGDPVEAARVVEVDRQKKRITVSLQSVARLEDERASQEARQDRRDKHKRKKNNSNEPTAFQKPKAGRASINPNGPASAANDVEPSAFVKPSQTGRGTLNSVSPLENALDSEIKCEAESPLEKFCAKPECEMSPAELKRARKLARRAARRDDKEKMQAHSVTTKKGPII